MSVGTKTLVLLFVALAIQCAFDGPGAQASTQSPVQEDSGFCAILDAASVEIAPAVNAVPQPSARQTTRPIPAVYPLWSLAHSIDHPPEQPA